MRVYLCATFACSFSEAYQLTLDVNTPEGPQLLTWAPGETDLKTVARQFALEFGIDSFGCTRSCQYFDLEKQMRTVEASDRLKNGIRVESLPLRTGARLRSWPFGDSGATIAIHMNHDANIATSVNGRVQCVLELERLFERRYMVPDLDDQRKWMDQWLYAFMYFRTDCICDSALNGSCPVRFENGVIIRDTGLMKQCDSDDRCSSAVSDRHERLILLAAYYFVVDEWHVVDHHEAHAAMGFHTSPFRSALVVSFDGGGNNEAFKVFVGQEGQLRVIGQLDYNLGGAWLDFAAMLPEVTGQFISNVSFTECVQSLKTFQATGKPTFSWAGKLMGYTAYGSTDSSLISLARFLFETHRFSSPSLSDSAPPEILRSLKEEICKSAESQRDIAKAVQVAFEDTLSTIVRLLIQHIGSHRIEGVVLTGGCALNVLANKKIHAELPNHLNLYVPPAPNDAGLSVGGLMIIDPPHRRQPSLQYLGFELRDKDILDEEARARGAQDLSQIGGVEYLADLLVGNALPQNTSRPIVAVVRGRQEFGPRALGHRSLLAVPDSEMRERMNRLKGREWYRPVAPMIAAEALVQVFEDPVDSSYMEMAAVVREEVRERFPSLAHVDGTARHQSVRRDDEPWVHALLLAVGSRSGLAALINTSFNRRGKPIANTVKACLQMLDEEAELDYVLIEDWLFGR